MTRQTRPRIGVTLDSESPGGYADFPWYALRDNYSGAIVAAGGLPLPLPHEPDLAEEYVDGLDGLVVTGGHFDIDPALFGARSVHDSVTTKDRRTAFEMAVTRAALDRDLPVLGICGGQQLLHVLHGGRLIQHVPDEVADALAHEGGAAKDAVAHSVTLVEGTALRALSDVAEVGVNSSHHQAALDEPAGVRVNARAPDGVIEGIEVPGRRYCLGVQWHPEFHLSALDRAIFADLIAACRDRR